MNAIKIFRMVLMWLALTVVRSIYMTLVFAIDLCCVFLFIIYSMFENYDSRFSETMLTTR